MRKVILYIAMSLDGCIADRDGGVGWLSGQDGGGEDEDAYSAFIAGVDTVVMGWNTYHQIVTELSPGEWVYAGLASYVITHRKLSPTEGIVFTDEDPCALVEELRRQQGKSIWICGGAGIARQLAGADLIDEYDISAIPTLLGSGIRLFETLPAERKLRLVRSQERDGIVRLTYGRR